MATRWQSHAVLGRLCDLPPAFSPPQPVLYPPALSSWRSFCQAVTWPGRYSSQSLPQRQRGGVVTCVVKKGGKAKKNGGGGGFGAKSGTQKAAPVDPALLLKRSELFYGEMVQELYEDGLLREFCICVRVKELLDGESQVLHDWLPFASIALASEATAETCLGAAVPLLKRELFECLARIRPSFRNIARHRLEFVAESLEDFYKHVYNNVTKEGSTSSEAQQNPYEVLGLKRTATAGEVKTAYRALAAVHHPDRNLGDKHEQAEVMFKKVTKAYEEIKKGGGHAAADFSRYAALGGSSARTLIGPIDVTKTDVELPVGTDVAVRRLESDVVNIFVGRAATRVRREKVAAAAS